MVPSPKTVNALTTLAVAARLLLIDAGTPKIIRDKLVRLTAELRDALTSEQARELDGAEAEAVIRAYAGHLPVFPFDEESTQLTHQKTQAQEYISGTNG